MIRRTVTLAAVLFFGLAISSTANELPDKVVSREFKAEVIALGASWTTDMLSTRDVFKNCETCVEGGMFFPGSRDTARITLVGLGFDAGMVVISYEWKKHVRNRYLNPLWRFPLLWATEGHVHGTIHNLRIPRR